MNKENKEVLDKYGFTCNGNRYTLKIENNHFKDLKLELTYSNVETFEDPMSNYDIVYRDIDKFDFRVLMSDYVIYSNTTIFPWGTIEPEIMTLLSTYTYKTSKNKNE